MELIQEPTNEFNKNDFFKSLNEYGQEIKIKCLDVSNDVKKSSLNNSYLIYLTFEILNDFPIYKNNQGQVIKINPLNQIIKIAYTLKQTRVKNVYEVSNHANLYPLLYFALKQNKIINENNTKGFNINLNEIQENLKGIIFNSKCVLEKNTSFKPYYKLITC